MRNFVMCDANLAYIIRAFWLDSRKQLYPPQPMLITMASVGQTSKQVPQSMQ